MASNTLSAKLERRKLLTLHPFPDQGRFFVDLSDADLAALADDIEANGLRQPIEVLPGNAAGFAPDTIIRGHQRRRALQLLGEATVKVLVRHDLAAAPRSEIEREFLEDNMNRRQLDQLAKARAVLRLVEIEKGMSVDRMMEKAQGEVRDRVGKVIGMSGRNLDRYFGILKTPAAVQDAFRSKRLKLVEAEKIARLPRKAQSEIAEAIENGGDPRAILAKHAGMKSPTRKTAEDSLKALLKSLSVAQTELQGTHEQLPTSLIVAAIPALKKGRRLIRGLIQRVDAP